MYVKCLTEVLAHTGHSISFLPIPSPLFCSRGGISKSELAQLCDRKHIGTATTCIMEEHSAFLVIFSWTTWNCWYPIIIFLWKQFHIFQFTRLIRMVKVKEKDILHPFSIKLFFSSSPFGSQGKHQASLESGISAILCTPEILCKHKATVIGLLGRMLEWGSEQQPTSQSQRHWWWQNLQWIISPLLAWTVH